MQKHIFIWGFLSIITSLIPVVCFISPVIAVITIVLVIIEVKKQNTKLLNWALALAIIALPVSVFNSFIVTPAVTNLSVSKIINYSYNETKTVMEDRYSENQDVVLAPPPSPLAHYELPAFMKKINSGQDTMRIKISLGYESNQVLSAELNSKKDHIIKIVDFVFQKKTYEDLASAVGMITFGEEIKERLNRELTHGKIKEVYFPEFIVE
ncbi:MAG: flagellar basal body-associated FliL family protein [Spirochaetes bacterium]|nr:flagellar basal body-associated FliL family protein [Spirochaetota bacterium]